MKSVPSRRVRAITMALAGGLLLSACMTATPYAPATGSGSYRRGYWDEQIEPNRFRVTFAGNSITSRETVERYLLYRSAQLAIERGFDYFTLVDRDTDKHTRVVVDSYGPYGYGAWGGGYWGPSWRYWGRGYGWGAWGPWGDPFWGGHDFDVDTIERYEATAEIVMGHGAKPPTDLHAFDARAVIASTGPNIQLPATK